MRDYEDYLLRQYARNALHRDGRAVITRPPQPLAAWLFEHAELLGCSSPETDQEAFDLPYGHVRREVWAQFAPLVAELKRPIQAPAPSPLARRLAWLCDVLKLTALESEVLGAAVRVRLHGSWCPGEPPLKRHRLELKSGQDRIEFDHIIAYSKGGSSGEMNIRVLCADCNRRKSAK